MKLIIDRPPLYLSVLVSHASFCRPEGTYVDGIVGYADVDALVLYAKVKGVKFCESPNDASAKRYRVSASVSELELAGGVLTAKDVDVLVEGFGKANKKLSGLTWSVEATGTIEAGTTMIGVFISFDSIIYIELFTFDLTLNSFS